MHRSAETEGLTSRRGGREEARGRTAHLAPVCPGAAASHSSSSGLTASISRSLQVASVQKSEETQPQAAAVRNHSRHAAPLGSLLQKAGCRTRTAFPAPRLLAGRSPTL